MRLINCEQGSTEWLRARLGIPTASRAADVLAKGRAKKDEPAPPGQKRMDYAIELAFERVSGGLLDFPVTAAMQRGTDLEPEAREAYEIRTGAFVGRIGFALHDTLEAGASPDGLIGDDGLVEIKCPMSQVKTAAMWATGDVSEYVAQAEWQLWITGRDWCDIAVYDPRLAYSRMDLLIVRHRMTDAARALLEVEVPLFLAEVAQWQKAIAARRAA